jgi:hypothetical protein
MVMDFARTTRQAFYWTLVFAAMLTSSAQAQPLLDAGARSVAQAQALPSGVTVLPSLPDTPLIKAPIAPAQSGQIAQKAQIFFPVRSAQSIQALRLVLHPPS